MIIIYALAEFLHLTLFLLFYCQKLWFSSFMCFISFFSSNHVCLNVAMKYHINKLCQIIYVCSIWWVAGKLDLKVLQSIQGNRREVAVFHVVIWAGSRYHAAYQALLFFSSVLSCFPSFFTYSCIYLCWLMLRPICLLSFLIECVAVKLEYLHRYCRDGHYRHPEQGSEVGSRQTLLPVMIKILVIFLDTSCIPYSSNFKNSKKTSQ